MYRLRWSINTATHTHKRKHLTTVCSVVTHARGVTSIHLSVPSPLRSLSQTHPHSDKLLTRYIVDILSGDEILSQSPHLISYISFSIFLFFFFKKSLRSHSCRHTLFGEGFCTCISVCWGPKVISHDALHFQTCHWRHRHSGQQGEIRRRGFPSWPCLQYNGDTHAVLGRAGKALTLIYAKYVSM